MLSVDQDYRSKVCRISSLRYAVYAYILYISIIIVCGPRPDSWPSLPVLVWFLLLCILTSVDTIKPAGKIPLVVLCRTSSFSDEEDRGRGRCLPSLRQSEIKKKKHYRYNSFFKMIKYLGGDLIWWRRCIWSGWCSWSRDPPDSSQRSQWQERLFSTWVKKLFLVILSFTASGV